MHSSCEPSRDCCKSPLHGQCCHPNAKNRSAPGRREELCPRSSAQHCSVHTEPSREPSRGLGAGGCFTQWLSEIQEKAQSPTRCRILWESYPRLVRGMHSTVGEALTSGEQGEEKPSKETIISYMLSHSYNEKILKRNLKRLSHRALNWRKKSCHFYPSEDINMNIKKKKPRNLQNS